MKATLNYLFDGNSLSENAAYEAMQFISSGDANDIQIACFLSVYNMRVPTAQEFNGFRKAMLDIAIPIHLDTDKILDIVGTGGDGKNTFNISTLACFVCAGAGIKVAKIGNYGFSSVSGSSNVLENLGVQFATTQDGLNQQLAKSNITFVHAPLFFPAMKNVAPVRKQMQTKTIFNILGPVINPCHPSTKIVGVHSAYLGKLYRAVLKSTDSNFAIVHAVDGYDEISLTGDTQVFTRKNIQLLSTKDFGFKKIKPNEIEGGNSVAANTKLFLNILKGKGTEAQNNVVLANAALAISIHENCTYKSALEKAKQSLKDGNAYQCLKKLKTVKN